MKKSIMLTILTGAVLALCGAETEIFKDDFSNLEQFKKNWTSRESTVADGELAVGFNHSAPKLNFSLKEHDNITIIADIAVMDGKGFGGIIFDGIRFSIQGGNAIMIYKRPDVTWLDSKLIKLPGYTPGTFHKFEVTRTKSGEQYAYTFKMDGKMVYALKDYKFPPDHVVTIGKSKSDVKVKSFVITKADAAK